MGDKLEKYEAVLSSWRSWTLIDAFQEGIKFARETGETCEWTYSGGGFSSQCGYDSVTRDNFCPHCGKRIVSAKA